MTTAPSHGPYIYSYTSAAQARKKNPGTDGGGADGYIKAPTGKKIWGKDEYKIIAFLPHHRDLVEDKEGEANAKLLAASHTMLKTLVSLRAGLVDLEEIARRITKDNGSANLCLEKIDWIDAAIKEATL